MAVMSATLRYMFVLLLLVHIVDFRVEAHGRSHGSKEHGSRHSGKHSHSHSGGHSHHHSGGHSHHHSGSHGHGHSHSHSHSRGHSHSHGSSEEHGQGGYKGCYVDNRNRVFPHSPTTSNSMTTALCKAHCKRNGYAYAGTEFGKQCFCGTAADFAKCKTRPAKNCYKRCPGNGKEICGGVWRISVYEISGGGGGGGGGGDTKYTTHYRVYNEAKTYSEAQKRCQQDGGHLADLKTPAIVAVVNKLVDSRRDYWIGLNDIGREGGWHWSDGVPLSSCSYKNWYPGEPNNIGNEDCGHLWGGSKRLKWNDMSCSAPKYFICQTGARQLSGCTGSPDGGGGGPHPGYKEYRGSYYRAFSGQFKTYYEAQQECKKDGGHLADLKTKGLADFVTGLVEKRYNYWIGLNDIWVEGRWSWSDGVELSTCGYKNWAPGQPPRSASMFDDCGHLKADQGQKWNDLGCYQKMFYICQIGRGEASGCTGQAVDLRPEYKGCYRDASRRKFPTRYMTSNQQTTSLCVNFCRQYKFPYAATEYGNQCYCGREQDFSAIGSSLPNAQCNTPCTGNPYQKCGGNWKMSVYKTATGGSTGPAPVNSLCLGKLTCPAQKPGTCLAWGDPHYITFDNRRHDFQGTCKYTLVRHADFTVAVRNVHRAGKSKRVAFCDRVEVTVYGYKIQIRSGRGRDVLVNGYRRSLPVCLNRKVAISISGLNVQIQTDHCFSLTYDGNHRVQIKVPDSYKGKLSGMCGNYNGRPNDDNLMPGGQVASTSLLYGNSWIAPDDDTCPDTRPQDNFDSNDISPSDRRKYLHPTKCGLLKAASGPFRSCNAILVPAEFVETCVFDMAAYQGDVAVLCQNLQAYADACVSSGGKPGQWRRSGFCAVQCPPHSRYSQCASPCPRTCADSAPRPCTKNCVESCVCDNGYVLSGANCVPLSSCGCSKDGNLYEKNEVWKSGNEICKCLPNRRIQCERQTGGEVSVEIGGTSWNTIGGSLSFVSIGFCGVWGVNTAGEVLYRAGTYGNERAPGTAWLKVSGSVTLVQISSGKGIVWGITARYRVYVRIGITAQRPQGTGWTEIRGRPLKSVCVSEYYVWGVTTTGSVYYRTGVTAGRQMGTGWALLRGPVIRGLSYVSIGYSGVWGVTSSGAIWYRSGTYGGKGSAGTRWVQVTGSLVSISVGYNVVWGVSAIGQVFIRIGITAQRPEGTAWRLVGGSLTQIYVGAISNRVWGCDGSYHIYIRVGITGGPKTPEPPVNPLCLGNLKCPGRQGNCKAWGDPHYMTFDNRRHDFQGTCKYTLVRHADFTVEARNVHRAGKSKRVAFCDYVEVHVHSYDIQLRSGTGKEVLVNGYRRSLPVCLSRKVAISISGKHVLIQTDHCLSVLYDGRHSVIVRLPPSYKGKVSGMCGNYNGRPNDDNLMPNGQVASTSLLYGNSWIAPDDDTCPDTRPQDNFDSTDITSGDRKLYQRPDKCGLLRLQNGPFKACISVLSPTTFFDSCLFDMAAYNGDEDMLCENLEAYSDDCQAEGGNPGRWRTANRCPMPCPAHSHYNPCGSACPLTCAEPNPRPCIRKCVESCVCDQGYVLSGSTCIPRSSCGCSSDGNYYQKNEKWISGNQICECTNRIVCKALPGGEISTEIAGTGWDSCPGSLSFVTIGWSGVWGVNSRGVVFYRVGTYGREGHFGKEWKQLDGNLVQISSGKGIVWGVNSRSQVYVRIGITVKVAYGSQWKVVTGRPLKSVCVSSSSNFVWGVSTGGTVWRRTGITTSNLIGTGWQQIPGGSAIRGGLSYVSIGYCGVWGVTSSGAIWYRSGTYGGKGSAGTRWVPVTGSLVSISVGYNVVWGVSAIGQVFIRIGITAQTPVGTAWRLVGGSLTQIYVSSSSNHVWGCGLSYHIYLRVGITWTSGPVDVPEPTCHAKADIHVLVDGSKSVKTRNFPSVRQFILKLAAGFEIGPNKARIGVYQFAKDMRTEFKMNQYNNRGALLNAIKKIEYMNKLQTKTGASLKAVYNEFTKANGARDDVEKVIILVTDGKATDQVREPAQYVKNKGAHVFTVGVAKYKIDELKLIASNDDYVATADDFDDLDRIRDKVLEVVCNADKGKRNIGAEVENGLQYLKRTAGELMDDLEGRENLGLETLQTETGEEAAMQLREMLDSMSELTTNAIDAGEEVTKEVSLVLNEIDQQLQDIRDLSDIRDPSNIRDLPEPDGFEESRDFHEPEELEEIQDFPEPEGLEEIRNLLELDGLEEIRNLPEPGGLEEIQEFPEPGGLEDIQEFPEPEGLEEIHEFPEPEGLEEIQADELEEIQNLPETGGLEEIQEFPEPGGLEEIQEFPEPEGLEEIQADELEEIRNLPEPGGLEEVLNELEELIGG
ncbi:FCGBP [Branchiostoma lanceolatum]|uniref:FCGBP protein n=1 Tax=Branchiostoma lanceolatum TaxID=7740 RepID=A0A8K0AF40_BRALA|nr:FCGBP [Branchiostoma lanceolatum]